MYVWYYSVHVCTYEYSGVLHLYYQPPTTHAAAVVLLLSSCSSTTMMRYHSTLRKQPENENNKYNNTKGSARNSLPYYYIIYDTTTATLRSCSQGFRLLLYSSIRQSLNYYCHALKIQISRFDRCVALYHIMIHTINNASLHTCLFVTYICGTSYTLQVAIGWRDHRAVPVGHRHGIPMLARSVSQ